ncbi:MAG TPA: metallophosphoesterase family protein [Terriglobia bacterium]|nr:metallophosphoesterase family protein [Terriglobia bacterium]
MRFLILSDIHSNLEAFEACMEGARGKYDRTLCLGDLVGYGPDPNAVIDPVRELAEVTIRGNHDKACCGITDAEDFNPLARVATMWTRQQLTPDHLAFLRDLPQGPAHVNGFDIVHGAPADEDEYIVGPETAMPALKDLTTQVVLFGHTHLQGGFMLTPAGGFQSIYGDFAAAADGDTVTCTVKLDPGARYLINPGSVGQPRDGDWRAAFAILDDAATAVEYYRTPYDLAKTQEKMKGAGLPDPLIRRLEFGR